MCHVWSVGMIKQHKILLWNRGTSSFGSLGFVFVQLDYNLDPRSVKRRRRLRVRCSLILTLPRRATIILMETGITGRLAWDSSCEYVDANAACGAMNNVDPRTRSSSSAWSPQTLPSKPQSRHKDILITWEQKKTTTWTRPGVISLKSYHFFFFFLRFKQDNLSPFFSSFTWQRAELRARV